MLHPGARLPAASAEYHPSEQPGGYIVMSCSTASGSSCQPAPCST
jgi:hypothetical protein